VARRVGAISALLVLGSPPHSSDGMDGQVGIAVVPSDGTAEDLVISAKSRAV